MTDVESLIEHYKELSETVSGDPAVGEQNAQVARQIIAKIKADAIREFVDSAQDLLDCAGDTRWKDRVLTRADRIETES